MNQTQFSSNLTKSKCMWFCLSLFNHILYNKVFAKFPHSSSFWNSKTLKMCMLVSLPHPLWSSAVVLSDRHVFRAAALSICRNSATISITTGTVLLVITFVQLIITLMRLEWPLPGWLENMDTEVKELLATVSHMLVYSYTATYWHPLVRLSTSS